MSDEKVYAFVYGTLKRGYDNGKRCLGESTLLGAAVSVTPTYRLFQGGVPFLTEINDPETQLGYKVKGELYAVSPSDFKRCDRLEGHPHAYCRKMREFVLTRGESDSILAWVYLWPSAERGMREVKPVNGIVEWDRAPDPQK